MYVDAGCLTVIDVKFLEENGAEFDKYDRNRKDIDKIYRIVDTEVGDVEVEFLVEDENIVGKKTITSSGKLYVGDACYVFDKHWRDFLNKTDYLEDFGDFGVTIRTGGDGDFQLKLKVDNKKFLFE